MFKNSQKISISKHFLIAILFIVLMFTSFGVCADHAYASDLNESVDVIKSELNVEDKLENSQDSILNSNNVEESVLGSVSNSEVLGATYTLNGGTFTDIRNAVNSASSGDTIKLSGTFRATSSDDRITINKKLTITSSSQAVLDGKGISQVFAIRDNGAGTVLKNLKFVNGHTDTLGGAVYFNAVDIKISNCVFENNTAFRGGALYSAYNATRAERLTLENSMFKNNMAIESAGAIAVFGNNTKVMNCVFDSNRVDSKGVDTNLNYGGAIQIGLDDKYSVGYVYNCKFYNNYVNPRYTDSHGGAGCVRNGTVYQNCVFVNNSAGQGGALTYHASGLIKNCTFINNTAKYYGGALSTGFKEMIMDLNVENCSFTDNSAPLGGAAQLIGVNIKIHDCNFEDNCASQNGGAINIVAESVTIYDDTFNGNIANVDGGAVFINGKSTTIQDSSFRKNEAIPDVNKLDDGLGGAIYINSTRATVENNEFYYNTARNGSAVYYDRSGSDLKMNNNVLFENQAWVYALPIYANDIYYGETEQVKSVIHGGNNIADYDNLAVSNAIYNAANNQKIVINGETPVMGATTSGRLYQDDREYNVKILLSVVHEDGSVAYNGTLYSNCFGEVFTSLNNLKVGKYFVTAKHYEDTYYKAITNTTSFRVIPHADNEVRKVVNDEEINYDDVVVWTLNIKNNGPNVATDVVVTDVLPEGLIWLEDDTNGKYNHQTGILHLDSLAVGDSLTVNIVTRINKTGNIVNNVNITAKEFDHNLTNNFDEESIVVPPASDLVVVKAVNNTSPNYNDLVKWTVTVKNNGPDVAHDVKVSDVLPSSLAWVSDTGLGNYNHNSGVWNIGTLNVGSSVKLEIVSRVKSTGMIENVASVSGREYDHDKTNNRDGEKINVNPASDLSIAKLVNTSVANYNDLVKWTITVKNNGPDAATGVKISDVLPNGFVYVSSTKPYSNGVINIGNLAVGQTQSVDIVTRVNITGSFVNVASVSGNEYDHDPSNNKVNRSILINPSSDLSIDKAVNNTSPNYNDLVKWTVTVKNNGPDVAHDVKVSDVLPSSLVWVSDTGLGNYNHNSGVWTIGTLNVKSSVKLEIVSRVRATGVIENVASVSGREYDHDKSNNRDSQSIDVAPASDLSIAKLVNASVANYQDMVKWTLTVKNNGPDAATGVKISDVLPNGFVYVSSTKPYSNGVINIGNLAVGQTQSVDIVTKVNITGSFVNVASVSGNEYDPDMSNNRVNRSILINPASDLAVDKMVNNTSPNYNDVVKWTITVKNNGPNVAHDVKVSDVLPKSLIFISSNGNYNRNSGIWDIGTLNVGSTVSLNIIARVNATGITENAVSVSGREYDHDKSNNGDSQSIDVAPASDLSIAKSANVSVANYHDMVKWTVTVKNNGPDAATGVKISDVLPNGFVYVSSTKPYSNGVINIGNLAVGQTQSVDIVTWVNITGSFVNVASVSGNEYDHDMSNNKVNRSILINPASDLIVEKTVNETEPNYNDLIKWTVTVKNNGPDVAHDVKVQDMLPSSLLWVSDNGQGNYNHNSGVWNIGTLNVKSSVKLEIVTRVKATGLAVNNVSVSGREYDHDTSNNRDSQVIDVANATDLSVVKLVNASFENYHESIKWTVIASNNGPDKANGVYVMDPLPEGLILINYTASKGFYDNGMWSICCMESGETHTLEIECYINKTGNLMNVANITGNEYDYDLSNNVADRSVLVQEASDVSVIKTVNNSNPYFGDVIEWNITVSNNGPDVANEIYAFDYLPKGLKYVSHVASKGVYNRDQSMWYISSLNNGESACLLIRCEVETLDDTENTVSVSASEYDWDKSNNMDSEEISPNPVTDLSIIKLVNVTEANYLDMVKWTLIVTNNGPNDATGVYVSDVIVNGLELIRVEGNGEYDNSIWDVGDLTSGESKTLEMTCRIVATGEFENFASVWGNEYDPDSSNNEAEEFLFVYPASDLSITKTVSKYKYNVGNLIKYTIAVVNNGPDMATNVEVEEIMDDSLVLKSFMASYGDFDESTNMWFIDELAAGDSASLDIDAVAEEPGVASNHVSVSSDNYDPDLTNNEDDVDVNVTENPKKDDVPENHRVTNPNREMENPYQSILQNYISGNPLVMMLMAIVFLLFVSCGMYSSKKR